MNKDIFLNFVWDNFYKVGNICLPSYMSHCRQFHWGPIPIWWWGSSNRALKNVEYPFTTSLPGPHWPGVVAPDRVLSVGQIELKCVLMLNWIVWNRTVYMYKMDLALNNQQRLLCH